MPHAELLERFDPTTVPGHGLPLDGGIRHAVLVLRAHGVETFESCEGGSGHASPDPIIRFHGNVWAGYKAFAIAMENGLPVLDLQLVFTCCDGQLAGPSWKMTFRDEVRRLP